eukprot:GHVL01000106.1.p1 GENE.GHVL01000106.1~~GHVL01000106.1.p1  ORF type:complete len:633 (-),score=76.63 GHVL01000106.1:406-2241(-)
MAPKKKDGPVDAARLRIAIVNQDKCRPKKCRQECKRNCPVVRTGKLCIEVDGTSKVAYISEPLCIGCGICTKKCPMEAITIINLPKDLGSETTHRFGPNTFKLHRLPMPRLGQVLGLVGTNGIGKSTALQILAGKLKPNLGQFENPPDWKDILNFYRGSELQNYFTKILEDNLKASIKPQYVENIPKSIRDQKVGDVLSKKNQRGMMESIVNDLELGHLLDREVGKLSGGEMQRFYIAIVAIQEANVYMFDEPSSFLDVKQRLNAALTIRNCISENNYVVVVEHDLSVLDYLSDYVCCLWGMPGVYGVVTLPANVREGINHFLDGFIPTENLRFREEQLTFRVSDGSEQFEKINKRHDYEYSELVKTMGSFKLTVEAGSFSDSEIVVMLGQNGTGKTTFIRMLAGLLKADNEESNLPQLHVSYKPQSFAPKFQGSVRQLFSDRIRDAFVHPQFISDVIKPLSIEHIMDQEVQNLSGGELQRVALILALGKPADIYLIDEPSAYLDSEQRVVAARVIKRYILHSKKTAFVVEHDFIMATYLADSVIVYDGIPGKDTVARSPEPLVSGLNKFLESLGITFRRDPTNFRPRINKLNSVKDKEQKLSGNYFLLEE